MLMKESIREEDFFLDFIPTREFFNSRDKQEYTLLNDGFLTISVGIFVFMNNIE